jgi:PleD family two-component response regulator
MAVYDLSAWRFRPKRFVKIEKMINQNILIVDDDDQFRMIIRKILKAEDFDVS